MQATFLHSRRVLTSARLILVGIGLLGALAVAADTPPTSGNFTLVKQVIAGGGGESTGGAFRLVGTVGEAATGPTSSGNFTLHQGFHAPVPALPDDLFLDSFE